VKQHATNPLTIASMRRSKDPLVAALAGAFERTLSGTLDEGERRAVEKIEARRAALLERTDSVEEIDYGAGDPTSAPRPAGAVSAGTIRVGDACRRYSRFGSSSLLLFQVVRSCKLERGLELGACMGISAAYQAGAMQCNGGGQFLTLEGAPSFAAIASETLTGLGLSDIAAVEIGPFQTTLAPALQRLQPIDYMFIDGHHDEEATQSYFRQALPFLAKRAVLVFDDIHWSAGMTRAWQAIQRDPAVTVAVTLNGMGVCVTGGSVKQHYRIALG
jgi:predicted O-methyltransferase YrrM